MGRMPLEWPYLNVKLPRPRRAPYELAVPGSREAVFPMSVILTASSPKNVVRDAHVQQVSVAVRLEWKEGAGALLDAGVYRPRLTPGLLVAETVGRFMAPLGHALDSSGLLAFLAGRWEMGVQELTQVQRTPWWESAAIAEKI